MGKLNISHHKSWHVYNQKNKDIVKRDELEAEKIKAQQESRIQKAEQEARLEKLRCQASSSSTTTTNLKKTETQEHFNLFPIEDNKEENPEYAKEELEKRKKAEAPFTMYLSQSTKEPAPWYSKSSYLPNYKSECKLDAEEDAKAYKDALRKESLDPIKDVKDLKRDKKVSIQSSKTSISRESCTNSIEKLRQQRLERETKERARQEQLLNPKPQASIKEPRSYHSQFNPDAVARSKSSSNRYNPYKYL